MGAIARSFEAPTPSLQDGRIVGLHRRTTAERSERTSNPTIRITGMGGFEPPTSPTPRANHTKLDHIPVINATNPTSVYKDFSNIDFHHSCFEIHSPLPSQYYGGIDYGLASSEANVVFRCRGVFMTSSIYVAEAAAPRLLEYTKAAVVHHFPQSRSILHLFILQAKSLHWW